MPLWSSGYNGLQTQLTHNAGKNASWARSTPTRTPSTTKTRRWFRLWRHDVQLSCFSASTAARRLRRKAQPAGWGVYSCPSDLTGWLNHGVQGYHRRWQLSGQFSHYRASRSQSTRTATPLAVTPGFGATYAQMTVPISTGRPRTRIQFICVRGKPWFDPTIFASPVESAAAPVIPNTGRNQFRGREIRRPTPASSRTSTSGASKLPVPLRGLQRV